MCDDGAFCYKFTAEAQTCYPQLPPPEIVIIGTEDVASVGPEPAIAAPRLRLYHFRRDNCGSKLPLAERSKSKVKPALAHSQYFAVGIRGHVGTEI